MIVPEGHETMADDELVEAYRSQFGFSTQDAEAFVAVLRHNDTGLPVD